MALRLRTHHTPLCLKVPKALPKHDRWALIQTRERAMSGGGSAPKIGPGLPGAKHCANGFNAKPSRRQAFTRCRKCKRLPSGTAGP